MTAPTGQPEDVLLADFDGDGNLDLAAAVAGSGELSLWHNRGKGKFTPRVSLAAGNQPVAALAADLNGDGVPDLASANIVSGDISVFLLVRGAVTPASQDCNGNLVPDECDPDCNQTGLPDACDLEAQTSADCDANQVPDECQLALQDCNANGVLDPCETASGAVPDCNQNKVPDSCDIQAGILDRDGNGIPDECERKIFHRGDPNNDGQVDVSDGMCMLNLLFLGGLPLACLESADANNDGSIDCSDPVFILGYLFLGTEPPVAPGPPPLPCGPDGDAVGSPGDLGCENYLHCP